MGGEQVSLSEAGRVDALMRLDLRQCRQPVAVTRGGFKFQFVARSLHQSVQMVLHFLALAGQKIRGVLHQL